MQVRNFEYNKLYRINRVESHLTSLPDRYQKMPNYCSTSILSQTQSEPYSKAIKDWTKKWSHIP